MHNLNKENREITKDFKFLIPSCKSSISELYYFPHKIVGSLPYCAPEQFKSEDYDPFAADVWSLGMAFYMISCKQLPFTAKSEEQLIKQIVRANIKIPLHIDPRIRLLLNQMLQPEPSKRLTCAELLQSTLFHTIYVGVSVPHNPGANQQDQYYNRNKLNKKAGSLITIPSIANHVLPPARLSVIKNQPRLSNVYKVIPRKPNI